MAALKDQVQELLRDKPEKWVIAFPGQASQYVGMGKTIYDSYGFVREIYEMAEDLLKINLRKICFEGPEEELNRTLNSQPALVVTEIATYEAMRAETDRENLSEIGLVGFSGHSLGEVTALVTSGSLSLEEGLRLVGKRAEVMDSISQKQRGGMLAVISKRTPVDEAELRKLLEEFEGDAVISNYNSPYQLIISAKEEVFPKLSEKLREKGYRFIKLKVSGAFHSPLMVPARDELLEYVRSLNFKEPLLPIYSPTYLDVISDSERLRTLVPDQMTGAVKWMHLIMRLPDWKVQGIAEVGPKNVLFKLTSDTSKYANLSLKIYKIGD